MCLPQVGKQRLWELNFCQGQLVVRRKTEEILLYFSAFLFEIDKALNTDQKIILHLQPR